MERQYFNRYDYFTFDGNFKIVPGIEIPFKSTDKYIQFKNNKDRLDKISNDIYGTPTFGWLILLANPSISLNEHEIPDNSVLRIPYPLIKSLQDYKSQVELYNIYYGQ